MATPSNPISTSWMDNDAAKRFITAERATRPFAATMVKNARLAAVDTPAKILDLACGTGAVTQEIYDAVPRENWSNLDILAGDISPPMLAFLKERAEREGWSGVETRIVDGGKLDLPASSFTHAFVGFGIFVMPPGTTSSLYALLRPGGFLAVSSWAYMAWYPLLERTFARMQSPPPLASHQDMLTFLGRGARWHDVEFARAQLEKAGCEGVEVVQEKKTVECGTPEIFMEVMVMAMGIVGMMWEEGKRDEWKKDVMKTMREVVVEEAGGEDGTFILDFEAIVTTGWKPQ